MTDLRNTTPAQDKINEDALQAVAGGKTVIMTTTASSRLPSMRRCPPA